MKEKIKARTVKLFILFLTAMFIMTFVSRMLYVQKMPRVTTGTIRTAALSHDVNARGSLEAVKKTPVFVSEGLRIAELCVSAGDRVDKGSDLIRLDKDYIDEKIADLKKEISSDRQGMEDTFQSGSSTPVFTESGLRVSETCVKVGDSVECGQALLYLDTDYLNDLLWDLKDRLDGNICQQNGYYAIEDDHSAAAISKTINEQQREYNAYYSVAQAGGVIYSSADGIVTSMIRAGDVTSDSAVAIISTDAQLSYSVKMKQKRLDELKALSKQGCVIKSPIDGVVTDIAAEVGGLTGETSVMTISDISEGFIFCADIDENDTKYISIGDAVSVEFRNGRRVLKECVIKSITKAEGGDKYKAVIYIEDEELAIGEVGVLKATALSDKEYGVVPLSAVTLQSGKNGYIYVVEEREGFLGVEHAVRRVDIKIEDSNDSYYGLGELALDPQAKIVFDPSDRLTDGQRVKA